MNTSKALPQLPLPRPRPPPPSSSTDAARALSPPDNPPRSSSTAYTPPSRPSRPPPAFPPSSSTTATAGAGAVEVVKPLARTSSRGHAVAMLRRAASDRSGQRHGGKRAEVPEASPPLPPKDPAMPNRGGEVKTSARKQRVQAAVDRFEAIARTQTGGGNEGTKKSPTRPSPQRKRSSSEAVAGSLTIDPTPPPQPLGEGETTPRAPHERSACSPVTRKPPPVYDEDRLTPSPYVTAASSPAPTEPELELEVLAPSPVSTLNRLDSADDSSSGNEDTIQPWQRAFTSSSPSTPGSLAASMDDLTAGGSGTGLGRADSAAARMESLARLTGERPGPPPSSKSLPAFLLGKHREEAQKRGYPGPLGLAPPSPTPPAGSPGSGDGGADEPLAPPPSLAEAHGLGFGVGLGGRGVPRLSALQRKALEKLARGGEAGGGGEGGEVAQGAALNRSHTTTGTEARRAAGRLALGRLGSRRRPAPPVVVDEGEGAEMEAVAMATAGVGPSAVIAEAHDEDDRVGQEAVLVYEAAPASVNEAVPASMNESIPALEARQQEATVAQDARQQARSNLMRKLSERGGRGGRTPPMFTTSPLLPPTAVEEAPPEERPPSPLPPHIRTQVDSPPLTFSVTPPIGRSGFDRLARLSSGDAADWHAPTVPNSPDGERADHRALSRQQAIERLMAQKIVEAPRRGPRRSFHDEEDDGEEGDGRASSEVSPFTMDFDESPTAPDFSAPLLRSASSNSVSQQAQSANATASSPLAPVGRAALLAPPPTFLSVSPSSPRSPNSPAPTTTSTRASGVSAYTTTSQFRAYRHSVERDRDSMLDRMGQPPDGGAWDLEAYASTHDQALQGLLLRLPTPAAESELGLLEKTPSLDVATPATESIDASHFPDVPTSSPRIPFTPQLGPPAPNGNTSSPPVTFPRSPQSIRSMTRSPSAPIRARRDPDSEVSVITFGGGDNDCEAGEIKPVEEDEGRIPIIFDEKLDESPKVASPGRAKVLAHHPRGPSFGRSQGFAIPTSASVASFPASVSSNSLAEPEVTVQGGSPPLSADGSKPPRPMRPPPRLPPSTWKPHEQPITENEEQLPSPVAPLEKHRPPALEQTASYLDRVNQVVEAMSRGHSSSNGSVSSISPLFADRSQSSSAGHSSSFHKKSASSSTSHSLHTPVLSAGGATEHFPPRKSDSPIPPATPADVARYSDPKLSPFPGLTSLQRDDGLVSTLRGRPPASKAMHGRSESDVSSMKSSHKGSPVHSFFTAAANRLRNRSRSDASASSVITPYPRHMVRNNSSRLGHSSGEDEQEHLSPDLDAGTLPSAMRFDEAHGSDQRPYVSQKLAPLLAEHRANPLSSPLNRPPRRLLFSSNVLQVVHHRSIRDRCLVLFNDLLVIAKPILERDLRTGFWRTPTLDGSFVVKHVQPIAQIEITAPSEADHGDHASAAKPSLRHFPDFFNSSPEDAVLTLMDQGYLKADPSSIARLLFRTAGLDKLQLAHYLCEYESNTVLRTFLDGLHLGGLRIDDALRLFMMAIRLPDDFARAHHLLDVFSKQWAAANPRSAMSARTASALALCIMEFNDVLHSKGDVANRSVSGIFALRSPKTPADDFVESFRTHTQSGVLSNDELLDIAHDVRRYPIVMAMPTDKSAQAATVSPAVPRRLLLQSISDDITVTIPRQDSGFAIRLHGEGLRFSPPVLSFELSRSCTFRITAEQAGRSHVHLIPLGPAAYRYGGLPVVSPLTVERAFMRHAAEIRLLDGLGTERRYMFSFPTAQALSDVVSVIRKRQLDAAGQTPAPASLAAFEVLRNTLLPANEPPLKRSGSHSRLYAQNAVNDAERNLEDEILRRLPPEESETIGRVVKGSDLVTICQQNSLLPFVMKLLHTDRPR